MNAVPAWFETPAAVRVGMSLIHFLWQGTLLGLLGLIVSWTTRRASSASRYRLLLAVFVLMSLTPAISYFVVVPEITWRSVLLPAAAPENPQPLVLPQSGISAPGSNAVLEINTESSPAVTDALETQPRQDASVVDRFQDFIRSHLAWIVGGWLCGVVLLSARLLLGFAGVIRLSRFGLQPVDQRLSQLCDELRRQLRISPVRLCISTLAQVPAVIGWLTPVLLLPVCVVTGLAENELRAILAHELAHIRRHDYLINVIQTVVETLLFYHPAVWWLSGAIRQERERCCDEVAAQVCGDRVVVARALATLEFLKPLPSRLLVAGSGGRLTTRIRLLLNPRFPQDDRQEPSPAA